MVLSAGSGGRGWRQDPALAVLGRRVIEAAGERFPDARPARLAMTLVLPGRDGARVYAHRGDHFAYPASLVKLFFMVRVEARLDRGILADSPEIRAALEAMIRWSSNDATSHIVDMLTGTTSGPALAPAALARWLRRRQAIDRYFASWGLPEFAGIHLAQKTWSEAPYGRERQSCHEVEGNRNRLSSDAVARLLLAIARGEAVSPRRSRAMMRLMARSPARADRHDPRNQVFGFLGEGLPSGARLWSKAGWSSRARHDAAIVELPEGRRFILAFMSFGPALARNTRLLPFVARRVARGVAKL
jgi:hypothetical protein